MKEPEYMRLHLDYIPEDIVKRYKLEELAVDGYVYIKIAKGMYGLKQAAILAYKLLVKRLAAHGYFPIPLTNGLFTHKMLIINLIIILWYIYIYR